MYLEVGVLGLGQAILVLGFRAMAFCDWRFVPRSESRRQSSWFSKGHCSKSSQFSRGRYRLMFESPEYLSGLAGFQQCQDTHDTQILTKTMTSLKPHLSYSPISGHIFVQHTLCCEYFSKSLTQRYTCFLSKSQIPLYLLQAWPNHNLQSSNFCVMPLFAIHTYMRLHVPAEVLKFTLRKYIATLLTLVSRQLLYSIKQIPQTQIFELLPSSEIIEKTLKHYIHRSEDQCKLLNVHSCSKMSQNRPILNT